MESSSPSSRRLSSVVVAGVAESRGLSSGSTVLGNTPPVTTPTTSSSLSSDHRQEFRRQQLLEVQNTRPIPTDLHSNQHQHHSTSNNNNNNDNTIGCASSNGANLPPLLYPENTAELPGGTSSYFEHWASPTEVLQLRSMCADVVKSYKSKEMTLRHELEELRKERELLQCEVQDTQKLRDLYKTATGEYEKSQSERSKWEEEREMMRLKLQRLSVDNQRLHLAVEKGKGRSSAVQLARLGVPPTMRYAGVTAPGAVPGVLTNSTVPTTGSTLATPSLSSGSTTRHPHEQRIANQPQAQGQRHYHQQQPQVDVEVGSGTNGSTNPNPNPTHNIHNSNSNNNTSSGSMEGDCYYYYNNKSSDNSAAGCSSRYRESAEGALREQLRLIEELHRRSMEYDELSSRLHFLQTLWDMTATRNEHRMLQLAAANETLRAQLRQARAAAEDATGLHHTVQAQLQECRAAADNAVNALQTANSNEQARKEGERRHTQECIAALKTAHAEEMAHIQQQLQLALNDVTHTRESLLAAQQKQDEQAEAQRQQLLADVRGLEQKCAEALHAQQAARTALAEAVASFKQKEQQHEREIQQLQLSQQKSLKEKEEEITALQCVREAHAKLTEQLHVAEAELDTLRSHLRMTSEQLQQQQQATDELALTRIRAEEAELEVQTQESYYTEQMRLQEATLTEMQKQRDGEVRRLSRTIERLQRRCAASKIRLAAAAKGIASDDRVTAKTRRTGETYASPGEEGAAEEEKKGKKQAYVGEWNRNREVDPVTLLQQSADLAATLARTIHREAFAT